MGLLVFQESAGGTINVQGTNTSSTITWTIPATSDTFVGLTSTQTLTNKTLTSAIVGATTVTASTSITSPIFTSPASTNLLLQSASSNNLTLDTSGNMGLAITPSAWSARNAFQIGAAGQMNYNSVISNGGSMGYGNNGYWNGSVDKAITTGYSQIIALNDNASGRVVILTTSGTSSAGATISYTAGPYVSAGGTSWTNSSDERLKNITGLITNGLESVNTLRAAKYTWKDDSTNKPKVGLIAQDVQKVLPEVIETFTKYNSEDKTEYLGVTYTEVIPLLVAAIQELSVQVTTQATTISTMQAALKAANIAGF